MMEMSGSTQPHQSSNALFFKNNVPYREAFEKERLSVRQLFK
jgi:hypothetical protein